MLRFSVSLLFLIAAVSHAAAAPVPNILWISAEDMSPTLGCYGDKYAITPNIDQLATESVKFTHAFATAPVCSPARSCLITGCYAPSLGTHNMRSAFPLPESMKGFPTFLRESGWYTTNNVKTDYNTSSSERLIKESWNDSSDTAHWRNRPDNQKDQPFFSVFNLMTSHQSRTMVWPYEQFQSEVQSRLSPAEIHDPAKAPVPPYYPDTPLIRREIARYYDCVTAMDQEVGAILKQLEADGLADDTIVFFYSDHGSGMPRHKRALLDTGMHVPLLIRFPERYQKLAPVKPGELTDRLVSFVDFAPTVLSLASIPVPDYMEGQAFLGSQQKPPRQFVLGHRDRVDEALDVARSLRSKEMLYIRNYMPHLGYNQPTAWPDQGEIRHEFYRLADSGKMTPAQWHFAGPSRPAEELYDCRTDPLNLNNLAESRAHSQDLKYFRRQLQYNLEKRVDTGFIPEPLAWELNGRISPLTSARGELKEMYFDAYAAADAPLTQGEEFFVSRLSNGAPAQKYWAAVGLTGREELRDPSIAALNTALNDSSASVRIAAADALARHGLVDEAIPALTDILDDESLTAVLYATRTIELMGKAARSAIPAVRELVARTDSIRGSNTDATFVLSKDQDLAMFINFSAQAFLNKFEQEDESGAEWTSLFDGKSLEGWDARAEGDVSVADGEIRILSQGQNLWLVHEGTFDDFELKLEALMPKEGYNSGIGFRCVGKAGRPKGYQCEIENQKSGMIYAIGSGWVWPRGAEETKKFKEMAGDSFKVGEWNEFRIRCQGSHIEIWVNGTKTADVKDDKFAAGSIALQHHGKGDVHRFRKIRIRALERP